MSIYVHEYVYICAVCFYVHYSRWTAGSRAPRGSSPHGQVRIYMLLMLTFINISEDPDRWQGPGRTVASRSKNLKKPYLQSIWGAVQVDQDPEKKYIWLFDFAVLCVKGSSGSQVAGSWRFRSPPGDPAMIRKYYTLYRSIRSVIPGSCHRSHEAFLVVHAGGRVHSWIFYKNIFLELYGCHGHACCLLKKIKGNLQDLSWVMRSGSIAQNLAFTPWAMEIDPDPVWISAISAAWQQDPDIYLYGPLPKSDNSDTEKGEGGLDLCSIVSLITAARSMEIFRYSNVEYKNPDQDQL